MSDMVRVIGALNVVANIVLLHINRYTNIMGICVDTILIEQNT